MARDLIDREPIMHDLMSMDGYEKSIAGQFALQKIASAPEIDAVEIVRCKDCALRGDPENCPMCARRFEIVPDGLEFCYSNNTEDDGFCHKGVKKDAVD